MILSVTFGILSLQGLPLPTQSASPQEPAPVLQELDAPTTDEWQVFESAVPS